MKGAIVVKAFNRPVFLWEALNTLGANFHKDGKALDVFISHDGPLDSITRAQTEHVLQSNFTRTATEEYDVKYNTYFSDKSLGCARHTYALFNMVFAQDYDYLIHIEDDHYLSFDCIDYLQGAAEILDTRNFFAACSFHRPVHQDWSNLADDAYNLVAKRWFDGSGPLAITKNRWQKIVQERTPFGVNYISSHGRTFDCKGPQWENEVRMSDQGSWVWPLWQRYCQYDYVVYPKISRAKNIGAAGLHADKNIHQSIQYNNDVIDNYDFCLDDDGFDFNDIVFDDRKFIEHGYEKD